MWTFPGLEAERHTCLICDFSTAGPCRHFLANLQVLEMTLLNPCFVDVVIPLCHITLALCSTTLSVTGFCHWIIACLQLDTTGGDCGPQGLLISLKSYLHIENNSEKYSFFLKPAAPCWTKYCGCSLFHSPRLYFPYSY